MPYIRRHHELASLHVVDGDLAPLLAHGARHGEVVALAAAPAARSRHEERGRVPGFRGRFILQLGVVVRAE